MIYETRTEYVQSAVDAAKFYIAKGVDANGQIIRSAQAYMDGTVRNANYRWNQFKKDNK